MQDFSARDGVSPGICHEVARQKLVSPGQFVQATDSHTCMGGCNNALTWGVGTTEYANLVYSGFTTVEVPESIRFELTGCLADGVTAKDLMLKILLEYAKPQLTLKRVMEFTGPGVSSLSMDERATLTNMATECSARTAIVEADEETYRWIAESRSGVDVEAMRAAAVSPDAGAHYDGGVHTIDLSTVRPMVAHPGDPNRGIPSDPTNGAYIDELGRVPIQIAYGGSCTAGKEEDLRFYHRVVKEAFESGRQVADGVDFLIQFGSREVEEYCRQAGFLDTFRSAGVRLIQPGCGACIGCGPGVSIDEEQVTVSAINRNYKGRSGPGKLYLASPLSVAASAFTGYITAYRPGMFGPGDIRARRSRHRRGCDGLSGVSSTFELIARALRNGHDEDWHHGAAAVVTPTGELVARIGDPDLEVFLRSVAKPFQALPLVLAGGRERFALEPADLAVICASHFGTPLHEERVASILERAGCRPEDLQCGIHPPFDSGVRERMRAAGEQPRILQNNCSGKHAGMLCACRLLEMPADSYLEWDHPLQVRIMAELARFAGVKVEQISRAIDGCSLPTYQVSLRAAARAYAALADPEAAGVDAERVTAVRAIVDAMTSEPVLVAGPGTVHHPADGGDRWSHPRQGGRAGLLRRRRAGPGGPGRGGQGRRRRPALSRRRGPRPAEAGGRVERRRAGRARIVPTSRHTQPQGRRGRRDRARRRAAQRLISSRAS